MRLFALSFCAATSLGVAGSSNAAPIEALSFLTFDTRWVALSEAAPSEISMTRSVNTLSPGVSASIDDPAAVNVISESDVQIGNSAVTPRIPFISSARERVNRPGPTQFADAQRRIEIDRPLPLTDAESLDFFTGFHDFDQDGLAQVRIDDPVATATSTSFFNGNVTTSFQNLTGAEIGLLVVVQMDAQLTARIDGVEGDVRTTVTRGFSFDGTSDGVAIVLQTDNDTLVETGDGASANYELTSTGLGTGVLFTASALATADGGFNEARTDVVQNFSLLLEIPAFGTVSMEESFVQANFAEIRPAPIVTSVPLPAGSVLLGSAFGLLVMRTRRLRRICR